jgi:hypothetical protein
MYKLEDSGLLGFDTVSLDEDMFTLQKIINKLRNYSPTDTASHPRKLEGSSTLLRKPQIT